MNEDLELTTEDLITEAEGRADEARLETDYRHRKALALLSIAYSNAALARMRYEQDDNS